MSRELLAMPQRLLLLVFLLCHAALAQAPLEAFNQALDAFEFDKAAQLAQKLAAPARELALAEIAVVSGRTDLSFALTDMVNAATLAPELQSKLYLIRAYQEAATFYPLLDDRRQAVARMIRDGLRAQGSPHDRAQLLLQRILRTPSDELAVAKEANLELAELEGIDATLTLQGQAWLAERDGRFREAANLWKSLAETARLKGRKTAGIVFELRALRSQVGAQPEKRAEAFAAARGIWAEAIAGKDPFALMQVWTTMAMLSKPENDPERLLLGREALAQLPDGNGKAALLAGVLKLLEGEDGLPLARQGVALGKVLGQPAVEAYFLDAVGERSSLYATRADLRRQARALLSGPNTRGLSDGWLSKIVWMAQPEGQGSYRAQVNLDGLRAELAALDPSGGPKARLKLYESYLSNALSQANAEVADAAFFDGLELALTLPESDRADALASLRSQLDLRLGLFSRNPYRGNDWARAVTSGLAARLSGRPEMVERILEAELLGLGDRKGLGYASLARWLQLLGRPTEAREMMELALEGSGDGAYARARLGELMLIQGDPAGFDLVASDLGSEPAYSRSTRLGWVALDLKHPEKAEQLARLAMQQRPAGKLDDFLADGPYPLLALALAAQGQIEPALVVLDEGMLALPNASYRQDIYLLARAEILAGVGRTREAAIALRGVRVQPVPRMDAREVRLRRSVAQASGNQPALLELDENENAYLKGDAACPHEPLYAAELARVSGSTGPPARKALLPPSSSLPALLESLERLRRREPENASLKRLSAAELKDLMARAGGDEIFVQPVLLEHSVATVYVTREQAGVIETFCDRAKLERAMLGLTASLSSPDVPASASEADRAYLAGRLVQPWRSRFPDKTQLRWMGDGPLQKLPLSALPADATTPLIGAVTVTYLDGPGCHEVKIQAGSPTLLVGGASDLQGATRELQEVRELFPSGQDWQLGGDLARLRALVPQHRLMHISTHGSAPTAQALGGRLMGDAHELSSFDLADLSFADGSVAVLGACDSNVDAGTGHDNTSLVSALRTAGADMVVGSLWPLDDSVTADLFASFYRDLRSGATPARALAAAQLEVRRHQEHPYYWAGLQVVSGP